MERKEFFWNGAWSLSSNVSSIPGALWTDITLAMSSQKRIRSWKLLGKASWLRVVDRFPVCIDVKVLPQPSIEEALNERSEYSRIDLLACVRVLKVIEQMVLSRTNGVSGRLTFSTSIAAICEASPSYVSVFNSMVVLLSYKVTERYIKQIIAERERKGPWNSSQMDACTIPTLQFDKWDIKPLHAVKSDQKAMPKVNGLLLQGITKKRKAENVEAGPVNIKRRKIEGPGSWRPTAVLGDREAFANSMFSYDKHIIL